MNAKAVFIHPKCEAELFYHNMCAACQQAYDYNLTMKWHEHIQAQKESSFPGYYDQWSGKQYQEVQRKRARFAAVPDKTKLQSKWISFPDGHKVKSLASE